MAQDPAFTWLREGAGFLELDVRVAPRSSRDAVLGVHDGALKIALSAPPVDGEANAALVAFFAKALRVPKSAVVLVRGERGRSKTLRIADVDRRAVESLVVRTT